MGKLQTSQDGVTMGAAALHALAQDAARYRFLRSQAHVTMFCWVLRVGRDEGIALTDFDAAVDEAMRDGQQPAAPGQVEEG